MYKRILVPTDGSELSQNAVVGAIKFAKALGCELAVMTVIEPYSYTSLSEYRPESMDEYDHRVREVARDRLNFAKNAAKAEGMTISVFAKKSFSPAESIIDAALEYDCDLILMASHGRKGLAAVLLGSETQKVLTHSQIPVLVYR